MKNMRLLLRFITVGGLALLLLIPLTMIRGTINERQAYRAEAVRSIARSYAGEQSIAGPVLVVPYVETIEVEERNDEGVVIRKVKRDGESGHWTFFADSMDVEGKVVPSSRRLGLHEVRVYELKGVLAARFQAKIPADADPNLPRKIGRPWLSYGIADVRGLAGTPRLRVGGSERPLEQGLGSRDGAGVHVRLAAPRAGETLALDSRLDFALGGTESLAISPLAKRNRIVLDSVWPHPQFNGSFLPRTRTIDAKGFHAEWEISSLATNAQAQYLAGAKAGKAGEPAPGGLDVIGLSLVDPVNVYSQADRASKYGILFIVLTFVGFAMFELIKRLPIHPLQYLLVGLALAIFFLLLLSLSEHIAFWRAYLVSAAACIGLQAFYLSHVLRSKLRGLGFAAMLTMLYAVLYGLLVSEDNALLMGSLLLFGILAAIMWVTRKVDWYELGSSLR
ncbi:cell envelope integrity protein CreD [Luteimonas sp. SX5]|uniref:Cell envelope integrity protein CreD n=1 Tax=Luteimonas galliterrae TaxID=2940486 RepID=A0ABT0MGS4_9GAMM|nr:cell envelope integrity protein CreD [Luteimonas galliterrae]MCL1634080.1 cell envelope integrity protein CreD [Luteimonas galliterrae]